MAMLAAASRPRGGAQGGAGRPHGLPEGRDRGRPRRPDAGLCALRTHYGIRPTSARAPTPSPKASSRTWSVTTSPTWWSPKSSASSELAGANEGPGLVRRSERPAHTEIGAVPAERLGTERPLMGALPSLRARIGKVVLRKVDRLSCVRFGRPATRCRRSTSGAPSRSRWHGSGDGRVLGRDRGQPTTSLPLVRRPSATSTTAGRGPPRRAVRPRTAAEKAFCALGPVAEDFIKAAAAAGVDQARRRTRGAGRHGGGPWHEGLVAALARAVEFGRFRAHDVRSIIAAGTGCPGRASPVTPSSSTCLTSPRARSTTTPSGVSHEHQPSALPADLEAGLRRLASVPCARWRPNCC